MSMEMPVCVCTHHVCKRENNIHILNMFYVYAQDSATEVSDSTNSYLILFEKCTGIMSFYGNQKINRYRSYQYFLEYGLFIA